MPQLKQLLQAAGLRSGEYAQLFYARREALDHLASITSLGGEMPASSRRGFRARVRILGRDRDGCLKAEITASAPNYSSYYRRRVRLVNSKALPSAIDQG